jgi:hypothetical protein
MRAYSLRLKGLPPNAKVRTVLISDQCQYWPQYLCPTTNLSRVSQGLGPSTYRIPDLCIAGSWSHERLTYIENPPTPTILRYKEDLLHPSPGDIHVFIAPHSHDSKHFGVYYIKRLCETVHKGITNGIDQTQALSEAVTIALEKGCALPSNHITLWIRPKIYAKRLLTLQPHRDTHLTQDARTLMSNYCTVDESRTFALRYFDRAWPGTPPKAELQDLMEKRDELPPRATPKDEMWAKIRADYTPSNHPSYIACKPPKGNSLPPAIQAAVNSSNRLITSTVFRFAVSHCFDADYSDRFRPRADDITTCPCEHRPRGRTRPPHQVRYRHTRHHVIFHCHLTASHRLNFPTGHLTLRGIFTSYDATSQLCKFLLASNSSLFRPLPKPLQPQAA